MPFDYNRWRNMLDFYSETEHQFIELIRIILIGNNSNTYSPTLKFYKVHVKKRAIHSTTMMTPTIQDEPCNSSIKQHGSHTIWSDIQVCKIFQLFSYCLLICIVMKFLYCMN